tara:strand:- start:92 stop:643 length:552 start_codon:yes stop_codon:yes gene_type:complete
MNDETTPATPAPETNGAADRIRQLVARVKELEGRVGELTPLAESAEKYRSQIEEVKASSKAEREALRVEREIAAAGITDAEGIEYVQHAYGRLPADGKPALAEWLGNRDGLPKAVRAYLADAAPAAPATPAAPAPVAMPRSNAGTIAQAPAQASAFSAEAISRMTPAEFKANRDAIFASLTTR